MKKIKRNKKGNKGSKGTKRVKAARYPVEYLGLALVGLVMLESALLGNATAADFTSALNTLDMSSDVAYSAGVLASAVEPMVTQASDINKFYSLAANEAYALLDSSEGFEQAGFWVNGVNEFYQLASLEMEKLLDLSPEYVVVPQVAGTSTESCSN